MSTTKVLHVIARMNVGGTAKYVGDLVANIPDSELATGYVQGLEVEDPVVNKLPIHRIKSLGRKIDPRKDFQSWLELRRIIKELHPEIVHTHTFKAGLIGRLIGGDHKRVHTFHGHLFEDQSFSKLEQAVITFVERFLANRTDLLISVGDRVGKELRDKRIGRQGNWASIAPGVTPLVLVSKHVARSNLNISEDGILVGWMARVTSVKNPHLFIEVAKALPEVNFIMAGGGDLFEEIQQDAPSNVRILSWTNAADFWSAVDLGISTSDNEGMPIALIEAQMAGVPVVATDVGSVAEVIENNVTGLLTDKKVDSLAKAITELIENESKRLEMSKRAAENSTSKFSIDSMLQAHSKAYQKLGEFNKPS